MNNNKKDLITDIQNYLSTSKVARAKLNIVGTKFLSTRYYCTDTDLNRLDENNQIAYLIKALSSPKKKAIVPFLRVAKPNIAKVHHQSIEDALQEAQFDIYILQTKKDTLTLANRLYRNFTSSLEAGYNYEKSYKLLNKEYNKLCTK